MHPFLRRKLGYKRKRLLLLAGISPAWKRDKGSCFQGRMAGLAPTPLQKRHLGTFSIAVLESSWLSSCFCEQSAPGSQFSWLAGGRARSPTHPYENPLNIIHLALRMGLCTTTLPDVCVVNRDADWGKLLTSLHLGTWAFAKCNTQHRIHLMDKEARMVEQGCIIQLRFQKPINIYFQEKENPRIDGAIRKQTKPSSHLIKLAM
nr:uncharacterized protein LOC118086946 [Zootoca vivipara]